PPHPNPQPPRAPQDDLLPADATSEEARQIEENRRRIREQEARRNRIENERRDPVTPPKPPTQKKNYPTAAAVPGRDGYVFNPFTNNIVDVRGIASGKLVRDPDDADASHKFRVP
ncbi:MAG: hypothetical protein ACPGUY_05470, partial [Akkermansiaceae bacterium]